MTDVSVLLLTEDTSKWATQTLERLCRRTFNWLIPQFQPGPWLAFNPVNEAARAAMAANMWKSRKPRYYSQTLHLCRSIATQLLRPDGYVFFHFDADVLWPSSSDNVDEFEDIVQAKVRALVRGHVATAKAVDHAMAKLVRVTPYYSIETWLFANVARLRQLGATEPILATWAADLRTLDQTVRPKDSVSIDAKHYPDLATRLKAAELVELQTSFHAVAERARAAPELIERLRAHLPDWAR